jgi:hypothetical protein
MEEGWYLWTVVEQIGEVTIRLTDQAQKLEAANAMPP